MPTVILHHKGAYQFYITVAATDAPCTKNCTRDGNALSAQPMRTVQESELRCCGFQKTAQQRDCLLMRHNAGNNRHEPAQAGERPVD